MKRTLEETVTRYKRKAEGGQRLAEHLRKTGAALETIERCVRMAEEHGQIADWLGELLSISGKNNEGGTDTVESIVLRCVVGACDETCKFYNTENGVCEGYETVQVMLRSVFQDYNELKKAESEGRLLILPCKPGTVVYEVDKGRICRLVAKNDISLISGQVHIYCECSSLADYVCKDDIGKTVFLTPEEAEQKLAEMRGDVE